MARSDYEVTPEQIDMIAKDLILEEITAHIENEEEYTPISPESLVDQAKNDDRDYEFGAYDLVENRMDEIVDQSYVCDMLEDCRSAGVFTVYTAEEWKTKINEVKFT